MTVDAPEHFQTYDVLTLLENSMGDCEIAEELLDRFQSRLASGRETLETRFREGDLKGAARIAHSLKGEAGILAAFQVHNAAEQLELALQNPGDAAVASLINELQAAADRCLNAYAEARKAIRKIQLSEG